MADLPANYNSVTLSVDPNSINGYCQTLVDAAGDISTALGDIMNCLSELKLSWTGDSAQVADEFNQRWTQVTTKLYGSKVNQLINLISGGALYENHPDAEGIINVLTGGIGQAAQNYANCEGTVTAMFDNFATELVRAGSSEWQDQHPSGSPSNVEDQPSGTPQQSYHTTAVNETGF